MNYKLLSLTFCFLSAFAWGQDKVETVPLERKHEVLETIFRNENGLFIKTGKPESFGQLEWQIHAFNPDMSLKWSVPIKNEGMNPRGYSVVSLTGQNIFHVEYNDKSMYTTNIDLVVTHITSDGRVNSRELAEVHKYGTIQSFFCDDENLYFLTTAKGKEGSFRDKGLEKLTLCKVDKNDFRVKKVKIDLPRITQSEISSFWFYRAHDEQGIYFVNKKIDIEKEEYIYTIAVVNWEGRLVSETPINIDLKGSRMATAHNIKNFDQGVVLRNEHDRSSSIAKTAGGRGYAEIGAGTFGEIQIDPANNMFYIYGRTGIQPSGDKGRLNRFFVNKYKLDGSLIWSLLTEKRPNLKKFIINRAVYMALLPQPNNEATFTIFQDDNSMYAYHINSYGRVDIVKESEMEDEVHFRYASVMTSKKAEEFLKNIDEDRAEDNHFQLYSGNDYEILIELDEDEDALRVMRFNKD